MLFRPFEPKALAAQEVLATAGAHYLSNGLLETGIKHVCTHLRSMIKLGIQIKKETLTFQPVIIPTYIPAENWENARYIFMDT